MDNFVNKSKYAQARAIAGAKATGEEVEAAYVKLGGRVEGKPETYIGQNGVQAESSEQVREKSGKEVESLPRPSGRGRPSTK